MIMVPNRTAFWVVGAAIGLIFGGVPTATSAIADAHPRYRGRTILQPYGFVVPCRRNSRPVHMGVHGRRTPPLVRNGSRLSRWSDHCRCWYGSIAFAVVGRSRQLAKKRTMTLSSRPSCCLCLRLPLGAQRALRRSPSRNALFLRVEKAH